MKFRNEKQGISSGFHEGYLKSDKAVPTLTFDTKDLKEILITPDHLPWNNHRIAIDNNSNETIVFCFFTVSKEDLGNLTLVYTLTSPANTNMISHNSVENLFLYGSLLIKPLSAFSMESKDLEQ